MSQRLKRYGVIIALIAGMLSVPLTASASGYFGSGNRSSDPAVTTTADATGGYLGSGTRAADDDGGVIGSGT